jgi:membrane protein implicated in regulation of membrane protease activity
VDARWNLGEFFLPVAFVFIFANILVMQNPTLSALVLVALYAVVIVTILDATIMWQRLKRRLRDKFGTVGADGTKTFDVPRGTMMYAVMRAFQIRRSRLPKPMHKKHGVWPE